MREAPRSESAPVSVTWGEHRGARARPRYRAQKRSESLESLALRGLIGPDVGAERCRARGMARDGAHALEVDAPPK